jgi:hypothetical protein
MSLLDLFAQNTKGENKKPWCQAQSPDQASTEVADYITIKVRHHQYIKKRGILHKLWMVQTLMFINRQKEFQNAVVSNIQFINITIMQQLSMTTSSYVISGYFSATSRQH